MFNRERVGYPFSVVYPFGVNADIDTSTDPEDVWPAGGAITFPASAAETTVVSSSANDAEAGTGARTVRVTGLDANYELVSEDVTLDGTSPVTLEAELLRVLSAEVLTAGSGGANAGDVDVKHSSTVLGRIATGHGVMLSAAYTIPAGKTGFLAGWVGSVTGTATADLALKIRPVGGVWETVERLKAPVSHQFAAWREIPEKADVRIVAEEVSADNASVSAGFELILKG